MKKFSYEKPDMRFFEVQSFEFLLNSSESFSPNPDDEENDLLLDPDEGGLFWRPKRYTEINKKLPAEKTDRKFLFCLANN